MFSNSPRLAGRSLAAFVLSLLGACAAPAGDAAEGTPDTMTDDAGTSGESSALVDAALDAPLAPEAAAPDSAAPTDAAPSPDAPKAIDSGATAHDTGVAAPDTASSSPDGAVAAADAGAPTKSPAGKFVMTWYSFQDNTPVNSALSASGRKLVPLLSVAVPFRLLKAFGGAWNYGDRLYVAFLDGRAMPNGTKHTGWVQIDDFCGDSGDDSYCFQTVSGAKYPNVDLYLGDFTKSGMDPKTCSGPAGSGQELTDVATGNPGAAWVAGYGGKALGSGKCGDLSTAKPQQAGCWDYTPPASSASDCVSCTSSSCTSW